MGKTFKDSRRFYEPWEWERKIKRRKKLDKDRRRQKEKETVNKIIETGILN